MDYQDNNDPSPIYLDLETSIHNTGDDAVGDHKASPYCDKNFITHIGILNTQHNDRIYTDRSLYVSPSIKHLSSVTGSVLVAQNISFDLSHLYAHAISGATDCTREHLDTYLYNNEIWDTMIVEYLLSGQVDTWISLDELAERYGGTVKDSRIKEYWKRGISTEHIPEEEIIPYLKSDVANLKVIYEGQLELAKSLGMLPLIKSQMRARQATIMMEINGMYFDTDLAYKYQKELTKELEQLDKDIISFLERKTYPWIMTSNFLVTSPKQLSAVLFGGTIEFTTELPILDPVTGDEVRFKTGLRKGQVKTKKTKVPIPITPLYDADKLKIKKTSSGEYQTGAETLDKLKKAYPDDEFIGYVIKHRDLTKQIKTYFVGYSQLCWPDTKLIHGQLNHCQTATGRLSSSKPNMQNISNKES